MPTVNVMPADAKKLDEIIKSYENKQGRVLGVLEEAQKLNKHNYLPEETINYISSKLNVPLSRLYSIVTFYSFFNLKPQGDHTIIVCRGTACHTKGCSEGQRNSRAENLRSPLRIINLPSGRLPASDSARWHPWYQ